MTLKTTCRQVEQLAEHKFGKPATLISPLIGGSFNILNRIRLEGTTPDVMVRLPYPGLVQFPGEKTAQETAAASYIAKKKKHIQIPIPRYFFYGRDSILGSFVILQHVESR